MKEGKKKCRKEASCEERKGAGRDGRKEGRMG
jgi:hypothetical protein